MHKIFLIALVFLLFFGIVFCVSSNGLAVIDKKLKLLKSKDFIRAERELSSGKLGGYEKIAGKKAKNSLSNFKERYANNFYANNLSDYADKLNFDEFNGLKYLTGISIETNAAVTEKNIDSVIKSVLRKNSNLFDGINAGDLRVFRGYCDEPLHAEHAGNKQGICGITYQQYYRNYPVWGAQISVTTSNGKIVAIKSNYYSKIKLDIMPRISAAKAESIARLALGKKRKKINAENISIIVYPKESVNGIEYYLVYAVDMPSVWESAPDDSDRALEKNKPVANSYFIDSKTGEIVKVVDRVHSAVLGKVSGMIYPEHYREEKIEAPFRHEKISVGALELTTSNNGCYLGKAVPGTPIRSSLEGHFVRVINHAQEEANYDAVAKVHLRHNWNWQDFDYSYKQEESNIFYHVNKVHDFFTKGNAFDIHEMDYPIEAHVQYGHNAGQECKAYSICRTTAPTGTQRRSHIEFNGSGNKCESKALNSDTIYHEYSHSVICNVYPDGLEADWDEPSVMHEGWADYFAATINNNACFEEYPRREYSSGLREWPCYRNLDNSLRYPEHYEYGYPHESSRIFSGSLWDLRKRLGAELTDELLIRAMKLLPATLKEVVDSMIVVDDDNQRLEDGTPHINEICESFAGHGLSGSNCAAFIEEPLVMFTKPKNKSVFINEGAVDLYGTIISSNAISFSSYKVEYALAGSNNWSSEGITLTKSEPKAAQEIIATFQEPSSLEGEYVFRLTVTDENEEDIEDTITLLFVNGWPFFKNLSVWDGIPLLVTDLENDGVKEILLEYHGGLGFYVLIAYHADGEPVIGFETLNGFGYLSSGDIDNDGFEEIVIQKQSLENRDKTELLIYDPNEDYLYDYAGLSFHGHRRITVEDKSLKCAVTLNDLDNDGDLEIISRTWNNVWVYHHDGSLASGWPKQVNPPHEDYSGSCSPIAAGDIDADGRKEIFVAESNVDWQAMGWSNPKTTVYAWNKDGVLKRGWPVELLSLPVSEPNSIILADSNNDNLHEVLIQTNFRVYILNSQAQIINEFLSGKQFAVGDLDNDEKPEIISSKAIYNLEGEKICSFNYYGGEHHPPLLADVDGDSHADIIRLLGSKSFHVFNHQCSLIKEINAPITIYNSFTINDFDGDQKSELLVHDKDNFMFWNLNGSFEDIEYGKPGYDNQNTNFYQ